MNWLLLFGTLPAGFRDDAVDLSHREFVQTTPSGSSLNLHQPVRCRRNGIDVILYAHDHRDGLSSAIDDKPLASLEAALRALPADGAKLNGSVTITTSVSDNNGAAGITAAEEAAVEEALNIDIPTREELAEIEVSSRLYQEDGATFMTATLIRRGENDRPESSPVTFIIKDQWLVTVRFGAWTRDYTGMKSETEATTASPGRGTTRPSPAVPPLATRPGASQGAALPCCCRGAGSPPRGAAARS